MLDVTLLQEPAVHRRQRLDHLVFFAMFGSIFLLTQYFQFVLGLLAARDRRPHAAVRRDDDGRCRPLSARLVEHIGTKITVATGLGLRHRSACCR